MLIQLIIILFSLFAIFRLFNKFKEREISNKEFYLWLFIWASIVGATIWFRKTDIIAKFFGVEKGVDLAVYISILALFYLMFKIIVKIDALEKEITKLVRRDAIDSRHNGDKDIKL